MPFLQALSHRSRTQAAIDGIVIGSIIGAVLIVIILYWPRDHILYGLAGVWLLLCLYGCATAPPEDWFDGGSPTSSSADKTGNDLPSHPIS
jgi:hypothetical protein